MDDCGGEVRLLPDPRGSLLPVDVGVWRPFGLWTRVRVRVINYTERMGTTHIIRDLSSQYLYNSQYLPLRDTY